MKFHTEIFDEETEVNAELCAEDNIVSVSFEFDGVSVNLNFRMLVSDETLPYAKIFAKWEIQNYVVSYELRKEAELLAKQ